MRRLTSQSLMLGFFFLLLAITRAEPSSRPIGQIAQNTQDIIALGSKPIERKIGGGESHSYSVTLNKGEYVELILEQQNVDVVIRLFDSKGTKQAEMDSPNGAWGTEPLAFISNTYEIYRIEVRQLEPDAISGTYRITLTQKRLATEADKTRFNAQQTFSEAEQLRNQGTAQAVNESLPKYDAANRLYTSLNDSRGLAICSYQIATIHQQLGDNVKALTTFEQSARLWQAAKESNAQAITLNSLGLVADDSGDKKKSIEYYNQALALFRTVGDKREIANTLGNVGRLNVSLGNYESALNLLGEALKFFQDLGRARETAAILTNLAVVHEDLGDYDQSLASTSEALKLIRQVGDKRTEAYTLTSIANVNYALGSFQSALDTYNQALTLFRQSGNKSLEGQTLNNVGKCYLQLGDRERALTNIRLALELAKTSGDRNRQAYYVNNIALLQSESGNPGNAEDMFKEALGMMRAVGNRHGEAQVLDNLGLFYSRTGKKSESLDVLRQALTINRTLDETPEEGNTLANLMFAWKTFQQPALAILCGKQAVNRFQLVRRRIKTLERGLQASYLTSKDKVYRELANLLISQGRLPEAQQVLRLLKEEEYFEFIRRSGTSSGSDDVAFTDEEAEWEVRYREISDRIAAIGRDYGNLRAKNKRTPQEDQRLSGLEHDLEVANQRFQNFLDELSAKFGNAKSSNYRLAALRDTQALQTDLRELGTGAVALFTVVGDDRYSAILVTPDAQLAREFPIKASEINDKVFAFRQALQKPDTDPRPLAQELYRILVEPISEDLKQAHAKTLMWSLDGALRYLPIAALHDGTSYLVERYQNVVFTLASNARLKDLPKPRWNGLGLGVSKGTDEFPPLAGVPLELASIIRAPSIKNANKSHSNGVLPGRILLDETFTLEAMRSELRRRYPLVHIASHFVFQPGNENDSFLLLGNGQHLTLGEIKRGVTLFDGVDQLTLSACDTATGGFTATGKEVEGFAVLAQRQGAKSVMATLWPVADNSTRLFMEEYYRLRASRPNYSKAQALKEAQLVLLQSKGKTGTHRGIKIQSQMASDTKDYSHPFYWAPFILIGNWK